MDIEVFLKPISPGMAWSYVFLIGISGDLHTQWMQQLNWNKLEDTNIFAAWDSSRKADSKLHEDHNQIGLGPRLKSRKEKDSKREKERASKLWFLFMLTFSNFIYITIIIIVIMECGSWVHQIGLFIIFGPKWLLSIAHYVLINLCRIMPVESYWLLERS